VGKNSLPLVGAEVAAAVDITTGLPIRTRSIQRERLVGVVAVVGAEAALVDPDMRAVKPATRMTQTGYGHRATTDLLDQGMASVEMEVVAVRLLYPVETAETVVSLLGQIHSC